MDIMKAFLHYFLWCSLLLSIYDIIQPCHARKVERQPRSDSASRTIIQPRIVGGSNAQRDEFPYFVQMGLCGGALIAPGVVLSAAHCRVIFDIGKYVTVRPHRIKDVEGGTRIQIVERIFHPYYDDDWASYDMILLRLAEPIYFEDSAVSLEVNANNNWPPDNTTMTAIGFGHLKEGENIFPSILQKVNMETMNLEACNETLDGDLYDDSFLCAGTEEGGKDTCQGDSGGPLIYTDGNKHVLTGLVSWGQGCGIPGMPGAYARVSKGMPFFKKVVCECWNVQGASFCGSDDVTAEKRSASAFYETQEEEEEKLDFECPIQIDVNCQDTPGYADYVGDGCEWHEDYENAGCLEFGDTKGGPGFEDSNALLECCWCGGGTIREAPPIVEFERHPECEDVDGYYDEFYDDCQWYEDNTEEGTCSGWGTIIGYEDMTPEMACCHCGGGSYPTSAPSPTPSIAPSASPTKLSVPTMSPTTSTPSITASPTTDMPTSTPISYVVIRPSLNLPPTGAPVVQDSQASDLNENRGGATTANNLFTNPSGAAVRTGNMGTTMGCIVVTAVMLSLANTMF